MWFWNAPCDAGGNEFDTEDTEPVPKARPTLSHAQCNANAIAAGKRPLPLTPPPMSSMTTFGTKAPGSTKRRVGKIQIEGKGIL